MNYNPKNPVIVQSDRSILLETDNPFYEEARDALAQFAELVKSPEHFHTYRITPLSLWNAASAGLSADEIIEQLLKFSKYEVPQNIIQDIRDYVSRYGRLRLFKRQEDDNLVLYSEDAALIAEISRHKTVAPFLIQPLDKNSLLVKGENRGLIKQALIKLGFPVEDLAGFTDGTPISIALRSTTLSGRPFALRAYQQTAVDIFCHVPADKGGGSGVFVLPCGAGKTVISIGAIAAISQSTLILCTNITALRQWRDELLDKTTIEPDMIGEYSGEAKQIRPITLTTYQILTYRKSKDGEFVHMDIFQRENWGLIIYDEVHLLPAPVFRAVADIQAKRRLGLTATLVREDGKEDDVFSLIGPKRYDVPWKVLEKQGWIATAECTEIRVPLPEDKRMEYAVADVKAKFRIASENPAKFAVVRTLLQKHQDDNVLIIGQYLTQLNELQRELKAPIITGKTPNAEREEIYAKFKRGEIKVLIVSKVANFAIDLPDANVAIQISGTFGSRQEEAQRLGRILRPKAEGNQAHFYSIITKDTKDQDFAANRQIFLTEQGYRYEIKILDDLEASPEEALAAIS
ncbi:MAG: DEAD/DEAH box helicase [Candidatus Sumerlaeia bacterium]